ncbi:hypothetical protein CDL12_02816 [Handroanthus impetiginosus]|uniref:S-protein homolog n=1 Tax=Handroanthus impetiginosus TaxID=429701 RepID=A0A2G9I3X1_9LAMI|nr:hypothetical protein CDL12_02816 [Handroanthus impetiginosus]
MIKIFLLFLEINILQLFVSGCSPWTWKHEVHITRYLPPNSSSLKLHCASKNDDLGYHTLSKNQDFHWSFCENIIPNTLFFCHLGSKEKAFNAFKTKWTRRAESKHYWLAKSDVIYYYDDLSQTTEIKRFDWETKK